MQISRRLALMLPLLMTGSGKSLSAQSASAADGDILLPEDFGATGYPTSQAAARGADATEAIQRMADEAGRRGRRSGGKAGLWYKTGSVRWPSGSRVTGLQLVARESDEDISPFMIDARTAPRRDLSFTDCAVDGNRAQQHRLTSSGGDGQRCGWHLVGGFPDAIMHVTLTRCRAWRCATDGFFIQCNGITQAPAESFFFRGIRIIDPDFQWNGRHGGSLMGTCGFRMTGGRLKNNGKDLPEGSGQPRSSGGWARAVPAANGGWAPYGRPWDCESTLAIEQFADIRFENVDMRDNVGGLLFHHNFYDDLRRVRHLRVERCLLSDPEGQTTGDGALIFFAVDHRTGRPLGEGRIAYEDVQAIDNRYDRHGIAVYSADRVVIEGGRANMTGPGFWGYYAKIIWCGEDVAVDVPSNRYRIWRAAGRSEGLVPGRFIKTSKRSSSSS